MSQLTPSDLSILLVEPSTTQQKIIAQKLQQENVNKLEFASNQQQAIEKAKTHPDLIVTSMYYEDGDAPSLIKALRSEANLVDIPVMLVSSETKKEQLETIRQSGVVSILPKPFDSADLEQSLHSTVSLIDAHELELEFFDVKSLRVLLVDDSKLARHFIRKVLLSLGIDNIDLACDGDEGIEKINTNSYDLLVTDFNMPNVNGRELAEYVRTQSDQSHIPILMVSSESNEEYLKDIKKSGVNALCDKPFQPEVVRSILQQLLED